MALANRPGPMHTPVAAWQYRGIPLHRTRPGAALKPGMGWVLSLVGRPERAGTHMRRHTALPARGDSWHGAGLPLRDNTLKAEGPTVAESPPPWGYNSLMAVVCLEFLQEPHPEGEPCATS